MIKSLVLASYTYFEGGYIGSMLSQWEQYGFFSYVLPFLLIFALIFGILSRLKIFTTKDKEKPNNTVNGVLAFVVALMSLQFEFVPRFFSEIFPRLGVGLAVILAVIILLGFFMPQKVWGDYVFFGIGAIILLVVLNKSFDIVGWTSGNLSPQTIDVIIMGVIVIIVVLLIVAASKARDETPSSKFMKILAEGD